MEIGNGTITAHQYAAPDNRVFLPKPTKSPIDGISLTNITENSSHVFYVELFRKSIMGYGNNSCEIIHTFLMVLIIQINYSFFDVD